MASVVLLTGPPGSGKTTVAKLLADRHGWVRICEDDIWHERFGRNRGRFGSAGHRRKRRQVHHQVFRELLAALDERRKVIIEATVHEAPPEAYAEYSTFFEAQNIAWYLRVLRPSLEVVIARDAQRESWSLGPERVEGLYRKFTGEVFPPESFLDTSDDTPEETLARVMKGLLAEGEG